MLAVKIEQPVKSRQVLSQGWDAIECSELSSLPTLCQTFSPPDSTSPDLTPVPALSRPYKKRPEVLFSRLVYRQLQLVPFLTGVFILSFFCVRPPECIMGR